MDGLSAEVGDEIYIIPLVNITESFQPRRSQAQTLVIQGEVVDVRGHAIPILRLHSESLDGLSDQFVFLQNTVHRKVGAAAPAIRQTAEAGA